MRYSKLLFLASALALLAGPASAATYSFRQASTGIRAGGAVSAPVAPVTAYAKWSSFTSLASSSDGLTVSFSNTSTTFHSARADIAKSTGKWYFEAAYLGSSGAVLPDGAMIGIGQALPAAGNFFGAVNTGGIAYYNINGRVYNNGPSVVSGALLQKNDKLGIAVDLDARKIQFYVNCAAAGPAHSIPAGTSFYPAMSAYGAFPSVTANFGASAFWCTVPSGYASGWY